MRRRYHNPPRVLTLKYAATCAETGRRLPAGSTASLTAFELDDIARQIEDEYAAHASRPYQAAAGDTLRDNYREYWTQLQAAFDRPTRAARVHVRRDNAGRWRLVGLDVFTRTEAHDYAPYRDDDAAHAILAAVAGDRRRIVTDHDNAAAPADVEWKPWMDR